MASYNRGSVQQRTQTGSSTVLLYHFLTVIPIAEISKEEYKNEWMGKIVKVR